MQPATSVEDCEHTDDCKETGECGYSVNRSKARAEAVLHPRCVLVNGLWVDVESYLARRSPLRFVSKPTVTHDVKKQLKMATCSARSMPRDAGHGAR